MEARNTLKKMRDQWFKISLRFYFGFRNFYLFSFISNLTVCKNFCSALIWVHQRPIGTISGNVQILEVRFGSISGKISGKYQFSVRDQVRYNPMFFKVATNYFSKQRAINQTKECNQHNLYLSKTLLGLFNFQFFCFLKSLQCLYQKLTCLPPNFFSRLPLGIRVCQFEKS